MEILAPAGNLESFFAALEAGADAIYVGLKAFSARALARNFTLAELSAMAALTRQKGRKLYVALNALVKEGERQELVENLTGLSEIKPDALIIQDLGVYYLVQQQYPHLPLHSSTLMTLHNSLGVAQAEDMGFKRVVLARELSLKEIATIRRQSKIELEVFVHGALCFSFSGLCLFSSYLGGRAGTRGRCTQPCRRSYRAHDETGFFLSPSDQSALELLPQLQGLGIDSIKIEGRMKSGEYVGRVVRAYRTVLDAAAPERPSALAEAKDLLSRTYSRRTTSGFFRTATPNDLLAPQDTGNIGVLLGVLKEGPGEKSILVLEQSLAVGDRLRVHSSATGERQAFSLKELYHQAQPVTQAQGGDQVEIGLPFPGQRGDLVYKVGETTPEGSRSDRKWRDYLYNLSPPTYSDSIAPKKTPSPARNARPLARGGRKSLHPFYYLKVRSYKEALELSRYIKARLLVELNEANYQEYLDNPLPPRQTQSFIWYLPPIIFEARMPRYQQALATLTDAGFRQFMLSNLGHFALLKDKAPQKDYTLYSDYPLHCLNTFAFKALAELGIKRVCLSVESDRETIRELLARLPAKYLMSYIYGFLPLMISRVPLGEGIRGLRLESPHQEIFRLKAAGDLTYLLPTIPFFWVKVSKDLLQQGVADFIVDLTNSGLPTREVGSFMRQLDQGAKISPNTPMNYFRNLE